MKRELAVLFILFVLSCGYASIIMVAVNVVCSLFGIAFSINFFQGYLILIVLRILKKVLTKKR